MYATTYACYCPNYSCNWETGYLSKKIFKCEALNAPIDDIKVLAKRTNL